MNEAALVDDGFFENLVKKDEKCEMMNQEERIQAFQPSSQNSDGEPH